MKNKYRFRRILSGVMAAVTILSTVISPLTVYASEEPKAAEPPAYESVKDLLDENEVVKAADLELEVGQEFDVSSDRTNLEIKDESKVKVTFQKAENDAGESFSTSHADTYHAVYYVEPVNQNHPVYQIGRNLIVKEPVAASQSEPQTEQAVTEEDTGSDDEEAASQEETETEPVETEIVEPETAESETEEAETEEPEETEAEFQDGLSESEFDAALEESETENTTDEESGLTLSDVLEQAGEQDIDLMAMEDGETVSFTAVNTSTRATQDVDVTRGTAYYYADYGLGSYVTYKYTVKFGTVSATAYCVQPSKAGPGDGVYKITKLGDSKALAKVCYYGTKASGENGFFSEKHPDFSAGKQFIIVHLAASYANNSGDAFSGTNATGQALAKELYDYCMSQPEIPEVDMSFSNADVTAYISGNSQRTEEITFKASELQTITMKLPSGVKLHNVTTGKTSSAGASVEICGGTKFYLSAPLTQAVDVKGEWSSTMKGSIIKDYIKNIPNELEDLQQAVGGDIEMTYPFEDEVGILLNGNGKFEGLPLNRALYDDRGQIYDAIAGTFLVVGLTEDDFTSLTPEQIEKFKEKYQSPEIFTLFNGELHVLKMPPEEAKEQKESRKNDAQQKNPAKGKKKNRSGEAR